MARLLPDPDDAAYQISALLVSELIANTLEHSGAPPFSPIRLDVLVADQRIRIEVRDQGEGFVHIGRTAGSPSDSYWGLHIVDTLATTELDRNATTPPARAGGDRA